MPQSVKEKAKILGQKVPAGLGTVMGATPYIYGVDSILQALASKDKDDRATGLQYGIGNIHGNAVQDTATMMASNANPWAFMGANTTVDTLWSLYGDAWFRKQLENKDSIVSQSPGNQLIRFLSDIGGDYTQPAAEAVVSNPVYKGTMGGIQGVMGLYQGLLNKAAGPASDVLASGLKGQSMSKTGFAPTGGPSFSKNPYAKK
jgi:hypothetical protein